jgi:hypothetical protein
MVVSADFTILISADMQQYYYNTRNKHCTKSVPISRFADGMLVTNQNNDINKNED